MSEFKIIQEMKDEMALLKVTMGALKSAGQEDTEEYDRVWSKYKGLRTRVQELES